MSLPPLPEPIFRYYNWQTESSLPSYSADQMREYGQQCYEQGKADVTETAFGKTGDVIDWVKSFGAQPKKRGRASGATS